MALGGSDLNQLAVLQALLEEGNVTRAALRVGVPQPAMSNALARLRRQYKDELLVRTGNGYTLTPLARSLLPAVREATRLIGQVFARTRVQPPDGDRTFIISLSYYAAAVLSPPLLRLVHDLAPGVRLDMRPIPERVSERTLLQYDVLIAPEGMWAGGQSEVVLRDRLVYVADPANPRLRDGRLSIEDLAALPHAVGRPGASDSPADTAGTTSAEAVAVAEDGLAVALERAGVSPDVKVTAVGWLPLTFLVAGTDLITAVPERLARQLAGTTGTIVVDPPFGPVEYTESAWWHPMHATDPALTWLRAVLRDAAAGDG